MRIALVLNGGVSLAVWMGGVTHELDRLRRSRPDIASPASPAWQRVCEVAGRHVSVDLVAGTSAGGLNGTLLATAIGLGAPLPDLRQMWNDQGRLVRGKLLRRHRHDEVESVLDGGFFSGAIESVVDGIAPSGPAEEVTLLVTSSALGSSSTAVRDARNVAFNAGDHRRVFLFKSEPQACTLTNGEFEDDPRNDFTDARDDLCLAARASAGFPFAFTPVLETDSLHSRNEVENSGSPSWLIDGGVLDNAPFAPLLNRLRTQPRVDAGTRWIVYVVPSATGQETESGGGSTLPPPWTGLPGRLWGLSRESDLRDDVTELQQLSDRWRSTVRQPEYHVCDGDPGAIRDPQAVTQSLWNSYLITRAAALLTQLLDRNGTADVLIADDVAACAELVREADLSWLPTDPEPTRELDGAQCWQWGIGAARRIALWLSRDARGVVAARAELSLEVRQLIARTDAELEAWQKEFELIWATTTAESEDAVSVFRALDLEIRTRGMLSSLTDRMMGMVSTWSEARGQSLEVTWRRLLCLEVLTNSLTWQWADEPPPFSLVLVSPDSASASPGAGAASANSKLYGTRLGHFGAFGSDEFREWDWLMGRLDGATTLADALLRQLSVPTQLRDDLVEDLKSEICEQAGTTPAAITTKLNLVSSLSASELIALARDSKQTDFNAAIDDVTTMLAGLPHLGQPAGDGVWSRFKGAARGRGAKLVLKIVNRWAKSVVAKQRLPSS